MNRFEATGPHVGVNFRRYNRRVSEQSLCDSEVGAVLQQSVVESGSARIKI